MTRKIIQIIETPTSYVSAGQITALCDDGTIWYTSSEGWVLHNVAIPQGEVNAGQI